jgi:hypothetical protein
MGGRGLLARVFGTAQARAIPVTKGNNYGSQVFGSLASPLDDRRHIVFNHVTTYPRSQLTKFLGSYWLCLRIGGRSVRSFPRAYNQAASATGVFDGLQLYGTKVLVPCSKIMDWLLDDRHCITNLLRDLYMKTGQTLSKNGSFCYCGLIRTATIVIVPSSPVCRGTSRP